MEERNKEVITDLKRTSSRSTSSDPTNWFDIPQSNQYMFCKFCFLLLCTLSWSMSFTGIVGGIYHLSRSSNFNEVVSVLDQVKYPTHTIQAISHYEMNVIIIIGVLHTILQTIGFVAMMKESLSVLGFLAVFNFSCLLIELLLLNINTFTKKEIWKKLIEQSLEAKELHVDLMSLEEPIFCCWKNSTRSSECNFRLDCIEAIWLTVADKNELATYISSASIVTHSLNSFFLVCLFCFRKSNINI